MTYPALSVVIPCYNEAGNITPLVEATIHSLKDKLIYNIILVDDASRDSTYAEMVACAQKYPEEVTAVRQLRHSGQSAALRAGILLAPYEWIVTLDGDGQNNPADIFFLLNTLKTIPNSEQYPSQMKSRDTYPPPLNLPISERSFGDLLGPIPPLVDGLPASKLGPKSPPKPSFIESASSGGVGIIKAKSAECTDV